jgi:DNA topoisomerase-3
MGKQLIITEKPSVAADIAKALGGFEKNADFYESDDYVLSYAVGHLLELKVPDELEVKRGKWTFTHLPMIPEYFDLKPIEKTEARLKVLAKLIRRKEITGLINACDAGREGELIFRFIAQYANAKQPIQRLWLQSMTQESILEAFDKLRKDKDLLSLADAARCRAEADWLVGINGTRAMTAFNSQEGGFFLTTVGRVQTPTLAVVVEREKQIRSFIPRSYWEIEATFHAKAGEYTGKWIDESFKKDPQDTEKKENRIWNERDANTIAQACQGKIGQVEEESKPSFQAAPALFDLTSLQREANSKFGLSAQTTLSLAQALYEKHKALTYPRTDSKHLPEDYIGTAKGVVSALSQKSIHAPHAKRVLAQDWIKPNKRIFDNKKVSDHFAIIPTKDVPKSLNDLEQKLYDLVVKRFLAVFHPAAEYRITTRITRITQTTPNYAFKTDGKVLVVPGWLEVYGKEGSDGENNLVLVEPKEQVKADPVQANALQTKPPARFTEATLLTAMETAGKHIDDEELREAMAGKGLGTPATRASIIEGLLSEKYLLRDGKELIPTAKGFQLMTLLNGLSVKELSQPELTGEWEYQLSQIEKGQLSRDEFMKNIKQMTTTIVQQAKEFNASTIPGDYVTLKTPCPKCGGVVKENYRRYACESCDFSMGKIPGGRVLELDEVETLLKDKTIGPLQGFRSKQGWPFAAILKITDDYKVEFDFGQEKAEEENLEPVDFSAQTSLGHCPLCQSNVYEQAMNYVCEKTPTKNCTFKMGRVILQQTISPQEISNLLTTGKTSLLEGFVSNRTRRKFKAFLVMQKDGKVGFEFEAKTPRVSASAKTTKTNKTTTKTAKEEEPTPAKKVTRKKTSTASKTTPKTTRARKTTAL